MTDHVVIVGAGALGQTFAAQLAASGRDVTLLVRQASLQRLASAAAVRLRGLVDLDVPLQVLDSAHHSAPPGTIGLTAEPAHLPGGAGVIFATKAHQLEAAVEVVRRAEAERMTSAAWVLGLQNGMQKDDVLAAAFGKSRVVGAATIVGAQHATDGSIIVTGPGPTYVGELDECAAVCVADAAEILSGALRIQREADVRVVLWSKACNAAGVFGVCALARCSGRRMSGTPALVRAFLALVRETADLASAYGVRVEDFPGFPIRTYVDRSDEATIAVLDEHIRALNASAQAENFPSMVQDVLAGRPLEVEGVFGDLVQRAARRQYPVPRLALVCDILRGISASAETP